MNSNATRHVLKWLRAQPGVQVLNVHSHGLFITARAAVSVWQSLLGTRFSFLHHQTNQLQQVLRGTSDVSVPSHLAPHLEGLFGFVDLPIPTTRRPSNRTTSSSVAPTPAWYHSDDTTPAAPPPPPPLTAGTACDGNMCPPKIRNHYNLPATNDGAAAVATAVFESGQDFSPGDLTLFQRLFGLPQNPVHSFQGEFQGDSTADCDQDSNSCGESNLDVQYLLGLSSSSPLTYWNAAESETFAAWVTDVAAITSPPDVISISYGIPEATSRPRSRRRSTPRR